MENCWSNPAPAWSGVTKQVLCKKLAEKSFNEVTLVSDDKKVYEDFQTNPVEREEIPSRKGKVLKFTFESSQL